MADLTPKASRRIAVLYWAVVGFCFAFGVASFTFGNLALIGVVLAIYGLLRDRRAWYVAPVVAIAGFGFLLFAGSHLLLVLLVVTLLAVSVAVATLVDYAVRTSV